MSVLNDTQFRAQSVGRTGGASRRLHDSEVPTTGYAVGGASGSNGEKLPELQVRSRRLTDKVISEHAKFIANRTSDPNIHQGSWRDKDINRVVLDASTVHASKGRARLEGLKRKERAIYDIGNKDTISLPKRAVK